MAPVAPSIAVTALRRGRSAVTLTAASLVAAGVVLALLAGCGGDLQGRLEASPARLELPHGGFAPVRFTVTPLQPINVEAGPLFLFVHLVGDDGVLRTFDQPLRGRWQPGRSLVQEVRIYQSFVGPPLPAGEYALTAGIYHLQGERLRLESEAKRRGKGEFEVAKVLVPKDSARAGMPQARFASGFLPVEVGRDQQILGRRFVQGGEAVITLHDVPSPGTLWLAVHVPAAVPGESELVLAPGKDQPGTGIETTCCDTRAALAGPGLHAVDLALERRQRQCEVRLVPDFHLLELEGERRIGPAVEILAWQPQGAAARR
jgi:hypothetical protein